MTAITTYLSAVRPQMFPLSFIPVLLGAVLGYKCCSQFSSGLFFVTVLSIILIHAAGNLVNTYYDYMRGVDTSLSDDRTLVDNMLKPEQVVNFSSYLYALGIICVLLLMVFSNAHGTQLAIMYFGGFLVSFSYTGGYGLKYHALGDVVFIVVFGPLVVLVSFMIQIGIFSSLPLVLSVPLAFFSEAVFHSNNTRDMEADKKANITTLAILVGKEISYFLYALFIFTPYIIFIAWGINYSLFLMLPVITLPGALQLERQFRAGKLYENPAATARLSLSAGVLFAVGCLLSSDMPFLLIKDVNSHKLPVY
ncbi:ubiA prenyltransferase domain-containing protein 1-like [Dysidea avara]|uniref:ubiA prenyltransferase domain-containing protein 1-like n=1 Tax=Dysidea avara TaxID=196820 RepID=UPI00331F0C8D